MKPTQSSAVNPSPFLRWAGSKRQSLSHLLPYWNDNYTRYVEPFMGSACLFFAAAPRSALLSDINDDLVETFNQIKVDVEAVYVTLSGIPKSEGNYYLLRSLDPAELTQPQRAARFVYLNRFCFNGLYRTNLAGKFNVPYAHAKTGNLPTWDQLKACSDRLKQAEIVSGDFESILLGNVNKGDFVYLDPPYAVENRRIFRQYGAQTFGLIDLARLRSLLDHIDKVGAKFVMSYADCEEIHQIFPEWITAKTHVQRNIAGFARHRRKDVELILSNISPCQAVNNVTKNSHSK